MRKIALAAALVLAPTAASANDAERVVREHNAAYAANDLDRFVRTYAPDAIVTWNGTELRGRQAIRAAYRLNFQPGVPRFVVVDFRSDGDRVFQSEVIVFPDGSEQCCSTAEFYVENGQIKRVYLTAPF